MKNKKGITLVALIITIIVMVILAGVIITAAVADGGIIERAQGAMKEKEKGELEDLIIASYKYKTGASSNVYAYLDLNATAGNIWENLTNNGFKLQDGSGNEYTSETEFVNGQQGENGEIDKIEINAEGKYGTYEGTVTDEGLEYLESIGEKKEPGTIPPTEDELFGLEVPYIQSTDENKAGLYLRIILGSEFMPEQEAVNFINKNYLESDEIITLEELDVRIYNKSLEEGDITKEDELYNSEKIESFEELKTFIQTKTNIQFGNDPANEIFLRVMNIDEEGMTVLNNVSDVACMLKYGEMGEKLDYKITYTKNNGELKTIPLEETTYVGWHYILGKGIYIILFVEGDGEYEFNLEMLGHTATAKTTIKYEAPPPQPIQLKGKYVKYDGKFWRVLYEEGEYSEGAQLISEDAFEDVWLWTNGSMDHTNINWGDEKIISEANIFDIDNPSETEVLSRVEKLIYLYNNAIEILNSKCSSLITDKSKIATDENGNYMIRNVGSDPANPNNDSKYCTASKLNSLPSYSYSKYSAGSFNGIIKDEDINYDIDLSRMTSLDITKAKNDKEYWMASRVISRGSDDITFRMRYYSLYNMGSVGMFTIAGDFSCSANSYSHGVRPVITLKPGVLKEAVEKDSTKDGSDEANAFVID